MSSIAPKSPCNENKFDLQLGLSTGSSESAMTSAKGKQHSRLETSQLVRPVLVDEEEVSASSCLIFGSYLAHGAQNSDFNCSISCNQKIHPKNSVEVEPSYDFPAAMIQRTKSPVASTSGISHSQNRSNSTKKCQFQGCEKGARGASGLCIAHGGGRRCQKSSCQKGAEGRTIYCKTHGGGRRCEFLGCTKSSEGRTDFCIAHGGGRRCNHEGCNRAARGKSGLCIRHGGGKRCQMENCTKSAEGYSGLCISHGGGRRCRFPACTKGAQGSTFFCKAHGGGKRCTFLGCTKGAEGSTPFCKGHGGGKRCSFQGGDVCPKSVHGGTQFCVAHGGGKRCAVQECTRSARGRTNFCVCHGGGKRCKSDGCNKSAQGSTDFCTASESSPPMAAAEEDLAVKAVRKRYEGLVAVRTKAIRGKGAWYWAHLEPILAHTTDTGVPKAVKLQCSLCAALFSASNPSRTASEHLKRGTCPNFSSSPAAAGGAPASSASALISMSPRPIASIAPCSSSAPPAHHQQQQQQFQLQLHHHHHQNSRKRPSSSDASQLAIVDPSRFSSSSPTNPAGSDVIYSTPPPPLLPAPPAAQPHVVLSGGKEDLGALAMLEDRVKKLRSPKASPGPALSKAQTDAALALLSDWLYETVGTGAVAMSSVEHPKFRSFLTQVGLPPLSRRDLAGPRLDVRYEEAQAEADARIRDALFFQLSSDGWKARDALYSSGGDTLVNLTVNLPNGTTVFHRAVVAHGRAPSQYAEEVFWDTITNVCSGGGAPQRCAGIVADRFKSKALRNLENQNHWMVNLSCQLQGFQSLIKDFACELSLFQTASAKCFKLASYFNTHSQVRRIFHTYQLQELDHACLLRMPPSFDHWNTQVFAMLEDILSSARAIQLVIIDEAFKLVCLEDANAKELADVIRDRRFWNELEAVHSLVKLINEMTQEMELERPLVGQCLPLWEELKSKVKDWCTKFNIDEIPMKKVIEKRFKKSYHPAWSAAFILDPLYLIKDASGKYLPPFKCLTPEQEKDVDKLITRLVSREEAHIVLMELMKWRAEGLDPLYAQAVQVKQLNPLTGKMRIASPQSSRLVWETHLSEFKSLGKVAVRLIFLHATSCGFKCNPSLVRWLSIHGRSRSIDRADKLVFIAANAKLERRDFLSEEEKDAELLADVDDDGLNETAFLEGHSM